MATTRTFIPGFRLFDGSEINKFLNGLYAFSGLSVNGNAAVTGVITAASMTTTGFSASSVSDALTAFAGGGQASALQLTSRINRVSTVASANDSVKLPLAVAGITVEVINGAGANSMQVFGAGTDIINDVATATGVAQAAGKTAQYVCVTSAPAGKWYRNLSA